MFINVFSTYYLKLFNNNFILGMYIGRDRKRRVTKRYRIPMPIHKKKKKNVFSQKK